MIKIIVTNERYYDLYFEMVQRLLFENDYSWSDGNKNVKFNIKNYIIINPDSKEIMLNNEFTELLVTDDLIIPEQLSQLEEYITKVDFNIGEWVKVISGNVYDVDSVYKISDIKGKDIFLNQEDKAISYKHIQRVKEDDIPYLLMEQIQKRGYVPGVYVINKKDKRIMRCENLFAGNKKGFTSNYQPRPNQLNIDDYKAAVIYEHGYFDFTEDVDVIPDLYYGDYKLWLDYKPEEGIVYIKVMINGIIHSLRYEDFKKIMEAFNTIEINVKLINVYDVRLFNLTVAWDDFKDRSKPYYNILLQVKQIIETYFN